MFQLCHKICLFSACINYNLHVSLIELLTDSNVTQLRKKGKQSNETNQSQYFRNEMK